jgi:hypothetical protein
MIAVTDARNAPGRPRRISFDRGWNPATEFKEIHPRKEQELSALA